MIGSIFLRALNVPALLRHRRAARRRRHDVGIEPELELYTKMFQSDFLHAGYFRDIPPDAEEISLKAVREAMQAYAELIVERVPAGASVLDVGCGTGGLLGLLRDAGARPTGLTPVPVHRDHIRSRYPDVPVILSTFEHLDTQPYAQAFDVVVSAESFHNVPLEPGLRNMRQVLKPGGKWIIVDYYRLHPRTYNRSGHLLSAFSDALAHQGFIVAEEVDISANTLPSLAFGYCWATRIGLPLVDFAVTKFFRKHAILEYLLQDAYKQARGRARLDALDPAVAQRDKRYLLQQITLDGAAAVAS